MGRPVPVPNQINSDPQHLHKVIHLVKEGEIKRPTVFKKDLFDWNLFEAEVNYLWKFFVNTGISTAEVALLVSGREQQHPYQE